MLPPNWLEIFIKFSVKFFGSWILALVFGIWMVKIIVDLVYDALNE